jgi:three-Cys-motif partner protein
MFGLVKRNTLVLRNDLWFRGNIKMSKKGKDHFELFDDHTLLKHLVLDRYVKAWASKLLSRWKQVWFVDAFAGEGGDQYGHPGSPIIAALIARDALERLGPTVEGHAPMRVLAFEVDGTRFDRLEKAMAPYSKSNPPIVELRLGTLHERIDPFVEYVGEKPSRFFLDPFGVDGLQVEDLPKLLAGPHNEIFAMFSDVGATRLHATLLSEHRNVEFEVDQVLAKPSLFDEFTNEDAAAKRAEIERSNQARRATQAASDRILTQALGKDAVDLIRSVPDEGRRAALVGLYMQRLREAGAQYVLSLPVRDVSNARMYQLVHASKAKPAVRTMKQAMSEALNGSSLPMEVRRNIQAELQLKCSTVVKEISDHFVRETVRWTIDKDRGEVRSVKRFLLEDTPAFPWQFEEIKQALIEAGLKVDSRPLAFRFR